MDDSHLIYEVFIRTEKREQLSAYLYSQVLGPFWDDGSILHNGTGLAIPFVSPVNLRMGISHAFKKTLLEHISDFEKLGIDFKEETTSSMLTTMNSDGTSSALTATWFMVETAYIAGVPQWWKEPMLKQVPGNKNTKEVLLTKTTFNMGDIRSSTWCIQAASMSTLVGTVLRTSDRRRQLYVISNGEYTAKKKDVRSSVGTRTPSANKPTVIARPVSITFSKRKRDQGEQDKAS